MPDIYEADIASKTSKPTPSNSKKLETEAEKELAEADAKIDLVTKEEAKEHPRKGREPDEYSEVMRNYACTTNPLAAFMVKPLGFKFETQDKAEKILLVLRKHVITNLGWVLGSFLGLLFPLLFEFVPLIDFLPINFQIIVILGWYLMIFGYAFESFLSWYFNVFIVTDERIIDYDFYSLLYKRVAEAKLDNIEDVTFEMGGVLRSFLNFGTVYIQTAGESRELDFEDVPKPEIVVKLLNELILEEEQEKIDGRTT